MLVLDLRANFIMFKKNHYRSWLFTITFDYHFKLL